MGPSSLATARSGSPARQLPEITLSRPARKVGNAASPVLHGIAASVGAFVLTLPVLFLMMLDAQFLESVRYLATGLTLSIGIGALTGWMNSGRRRED